ncbi:MAG: kelch repeat-containing protein [archaeon]|nr:kelch repeat-containing protein [archaeon]
MAAKPTFQCTKLTEVLPVPFKSVSATFVPPAGAVFAFWNGKLSRLLASSLTWCPVEDVKGLPGLVAPCLTADERLFVMGQTGMTMGDISLFSIRPEQQQPGRVVYLATAEARPPPFQKSVLCAVGSTVVVFGETYLDEISDGPCRVACFSSPEGRWLQREPQGEAPRLRQRLSAVPLDDRRCLVFMPTEDELAYELYRFDTFDHSWTPLPTSLAPGAPHPLPLRGSAFSRLGRYVVVTGGLRMVRYTNAVYLFDTATSTWIDPSSCFSGELFSPRGSHASVAISDSSLILFGGTADAQAPRDMYRIDLTSSE